MFYVVRKTNGEREMCDCQLFLAGGTKAFLQDFCAEIVTFFSGKVGKVGKSWVSKFLKT